MKAPILSACLFLAGCKIYYKDNLHLPDELRIREFPWEERQERKLPAAFKYLPSIT